MEHHKYSSLSLRVGLSIVLFWFAFKQLMNPQSWTGLVPSWISSMINPIYVVYANANLEIILGILMLLGLFTRVVATILTIHLIPIIFALGLNTPSAIRDVGLLFASLALAFLGASYLSLDSLIKKRRKKK